MDTGYIKSRSMPTTENSHRQDLKLRKKKKTNNSMSIVFLVKTPFIFLLHFFYVFFAMVCRKFVWTFNGQDGGKL
jgi:hypothetical protein